MIYSCDYSWLALFAKALFLRACYWAAMTRSTSSSLYIVDYTGSLEKLNFSAHGYCDSFVLSMFDHEWQPGLNESQTIDT